MYFFVFFRKGKNRDQQARGALFVAGAPDATCPFRAAGQAAATLAPPSVLIIHTCGPPSRQRVGKRRATYRVWIMKAQTVGDTPTSWEETRVPPPSSPPSPPTPLPPPPAASRQGSDRFRPSEQESQHVCIKRRIDFVFSCGERGCVDVGVCFAKAGRNEQQWISVVLTLKYPCFHLLWMSFI